MGSRRGKEGLLLAVFWVVAIALIGTAANRLILHGPLGGTLQKKETGRMLMELSVLFLWNLWWLCLAVKQGKKRTGYSLSDTRLAFVPLGTQDTDPADRGWCVDGNAGWIWHLHQQLFFGKYWKKKQSCFSCLGEDPSGADHRKRSMDGPCMCSFSYRTWGNRALEKAGVAACSGDCGNFSVEK